MRLCPNEVGVCETDFVETLELLEADGEELLGFGFCDSPCRRRGAEPVTSATEG
jgi:hypothetical protein